MNFERYKDKIIECTANNERIVIVGDKPELCSETLCNSCGFYSNVDNSCNVNNEEYSEKMKIWLLEDDSEPSPERLKGQEEAWKLAQRIGSNTLESLCQQDMIEIFGESSSLLVFENRSYTEAAAMVGAWEKRKMLRIGDVIRHKVTGIAGVVVDCDYNDMTCDVLTEDGYRKIWEVDNCAKVDRTLPVLKWLRQIGEGEKND